MLNEFSTLFDYWSFNQVSVKGHIARGHMTHLLWPIYTLCSAWDWRTFSFLPAHRIIVTTAAASLPALCTSHFLLITLVNQHLSGPLPSKENLCPHSPLHWRRMQILRRITMHSVFLVSIVLLKKGKLTVLLFNFPLLHSQIVHQQSDA